MKVVALFRVSTEKQAHEGASLDSQQREYRELAARNGWITVAEFRGCESATQAASERRVLQQVLACIAETAPDCLYVHEQSRLSRGDELEVHLLMRELKERGIKILVHGILRDPGSIDDRFMLGIQSLVDRTESDRIKERLTRGKKQRAIQGRKTGGPAAFGYRNPSPGDPKRGTLQIVLEEAAVVRRVYDMALNRGMGTQAIAAELNRLGIPSSRGGEWVKTAIERMLVNPVYCGTSAANVWKRVGRTRAFRLDLASPGATLVENAHEPIIPREVWDAVQTRPKRVCTKVPRLLTGLLHINGHAYGGDSSRYGSFYRSSRTQRGLPWLHTEAVDDAVWAAFVSLATGPEFVQSLIKAGETPKQRELAAMEVEHLTDQVGKKRRRLDRLVEMRADGEIEKADFLQRSARERQELEAMEAELKVQQAKAAAADPSHAARIVRAVQVLLAGRTRLTTDQKRSILRAVVRRVDVEAGRTGALQARVAGGRLASGRFPQWKVEKVTLHVLGDLNVPETAPVEVGDGDGQLATTFSCLAPPAPARR